MDALWKCLLACILALSHDIAAAMVSIQTFDEPAVRKLVEEKKLEISTIPMDLVLDSLPLSISANSIDPKLVSLPEYQKVRKLMRELGIKSVVSAGQYTIFTFNESGLGPVLVATSCVGFSELFKVPPSLHRIDDYWAVVPNADAASAIKILTEMKPRSQ